MSNNKILVKKLSDDAIIPTRGSSMSAGMDLYSVEELEILPGQHFIVSAGIAVSVPEGTYLRIAPRSGMAAKHGIDTLGGVVDADYRGEIKVILANFGMNPFKVNKGDRIAQAILEKVDYATVVEADTLDVTERNTDGFGSTGT